MIVKKKLNHFEVAVVVKCGIRCSCTRTFKKLGSLPVPWRTHWRKCCCGALTLQKEAESGRFLPNHACWSPCTSMASPKSASFTAAPFILLARRRFSGCNTRRRIIWEDQTQSEAASSSLSLGFTLKCQELKYRNTASTVKLKKSHLSYL